MNWKFFRRNKQKPEGFYEDKFDKQEWFIFQANKTLFGIGIPIVIPAEKVEHFAIKLIKAANEYDPTCEQRLKDYLNKDPELKEE